jgi:hypothetical protein
MNIEKMTTTLQQALAEAQKIAQVQTTSKYRNRTSLEIYDSAWAVCA